MLDIVKEEDVIIEGMKGIVDTEIMLNMTKNKSDILETVDGEKIDITKYRAKERQSYRCCNEKILRISIWDKTWYPSGDWFAYFWCKNCKNFYKIKMDNEERNWVIDNIDVRKGEKDIDMIKVKKKK